MAVSDIYEKVEMENLLFPDIGTIKPVEFFNVHVAIDNNKKEIDI